ncbi:PIG-L family deacetylase [Streptomyces sp. NBC_00503]|uniref:PIG-L family deacetylase n=1 Tax=Streptomyces sp. NBC_00503 TaxID=2903659 RepID=UPI002E809386|nr:PIG-L family deacetylase [Streptomyces sp. NBC_00503]WUD79265.1 PIG-L family deacetylase [Streptomyces sp. NBC_00503]
MTPSRHRAAPSRRNFMLASAAVTLVGAAGYAAASWPGGTDGADDGAGAHSDPAVPLVSSESVMQIVAHADDDLFFMNPDTGHSLRSGRPMTSVYMTAGEADGVNAPGFASAGHPMPPADRAQYAEARQNGIRAAYAQMATGDKTSPWTRTSIPTTGGGSAELDTLQAHPQINLVWMQVREAREMYKDVPQSLRGLWNGQTHSLEPVPASATPAKPISYTKDQLVDALVVLMAHFRPTHIRTLDPSPAREGVRHQIVDHQDHVFSARFAQAALQKYAATSGRPNFTVQSYLGYNTSYLPHAFDQAQADAKAETVKTYAWMDPKDNFCGSKAGCGDRKVSNRPYGNNWAQSVRYSRANSTSWLQPGEDGSLWAFGVLDQKLAVWHKPSGTKDTWAGPNLLAADGLLDGGLTAVRLPDSRIAVFGTCTHLGPGGDYRREVVTAVQQRPEGDFGPFRALGSPPQSGASALSDLSAPAPAVDGSGRLAVFVRGGDLRLYRIEQDATGKWSAWTDLGGTGLHGDPAATTDRAGRIHVLAATPESVLTWAQAKPGAPLPARPQQSGLPATTVGGLSACADGDGVRVFFRKPDSGAVQTAVLDGSGRPVVLDVGGVGGYGAVGLCGTAIAGRGPDGTLGTALIGSGTPQWSSAELLISGAPAGMRTGSHGFLTALGLDAKLYWARTSEADAPKWRLAPG